MEKKITTGEVVAIVVGLVAAVALWIAFAAISGNYMAKYVKRLGVELEKNTITSTEFLDKKEVGDTYFYDADNDGIGIYCEKNGEILESNEDEGNNSIQFRAFQTGTDMYTVLATEKENSKIIRIQSDSYEVLAEAEDSEQDFYPLAEGNGIWFFTNDCYDDETITKSTVLKYKENGEFEEVKELKSFHLLYSGWIDGENLYFTASADEYDDYYSLYVWNYKEKGAQPRLIQEQLDSYDFVEKEGQIYYDLDGKMPLKDGTIASGYTRYLINETILLTFDGYVDADADCYAYDIRTGQLLFEGNDVVGFNYDENGINLINRNKGIVRHDIKK